MCFAKLCIEILAVTTCSLTQKKKKLNIDNTLYVCLSYDFPRKEKKRKAIISLYNVNRLILFFMVALPLVLYY